MLDLVRSYLPLSGGQVAILRPSHRPGHDIDAGHAVRADTSVAALPSASSPQHFPAGGEVEHEPEDLWATTVETRRSARRDAGARAADIAAIGMASHHRQNGAGNAEPSQQLSALGLRPVRLHGGEKIGGLEAERRGCACQKQPVQDVMFCQPYNVVTRWRSVSLGLYSCNGAALRVLSA